MRCLALAQEMAEAGWRIVFATIAETAAMVPALAIEGFATEILPDEANDADILARRFGSGVDLLVVDHYGRDAAFERQCRAFARRVLVLDDATGREHDCDLLLDSAATDPAAYRAHVPPHAQLLCGPDFALVRREFLARRKEALARRDGRPVENILLSFGATDPWNATSMVLDALDEALGDVRVTIAMSSRAPHLDKVSKRLGGHRRLVLDGDMPDLMTQADLAIGAAGATSYERAVLGLPTVLLTLADNQRGLAGLLTSANAAIDGGDIGSASNGRLRGIVLRVIEDRTTLMRMAQNAAGLVDGHGVRRIVEYLGSVRGGGCA